MNIRLNYLENELKEVKKEIVAKVTVDNKVNETKNTEDNMKVKNSVKEVADKVKEISNAEEGSQAVRSDNVTSVTTDVKS